MLAFAEFEHVISKSPDFAKWVHDVKWSWMSWDQDWGCNSSCLFILKYQSLYATSLNIWSFISVTYLRCFIPFRGLSSREWPQESLYLSILWHSITLVKALGVVPTSPFFWISSPFKVQQCHHNHRHTSGCHGNQASFSPLLKWTPSKERITWVYFFTERRWQCCTNWYLNIPDMIFKYVKKSWFMTPLHCNNVIKCKL